MALPCLLYMPLLAVWTQAGFDDVSPTWFNRSVLSLSFSLLERCLDVLEPRMQLLPDERERQRQGGAIAGIFAPNTVTASRCGPRALPWINVVFSADRGTIISGYQASGLAELDIPAEARWLK